MVDFEELYVKGSTKNKRKLAELAVTFAKSILFPRHRNVVVEVELIPDLNGKEGIWGDCIDDDDRWYIVRVDSKLSAKDFVETILHEMVHVKQYVRKELVQHSIKHQLWKGGQIPSETKYEERPWEIEAFSLEKDLSESFITTHGWKFLGV